MSSGNPPGSSLLSMQDRFEQLLVEPFVSHCLIEAVVQSDFNPAAAFGWYGDTGKALLKAIRISTISSSTEHPLLSTPDV